ncbi:DUF4167 domain-containing protein [Candidatus Pelagibacter sp.]|jgi:hypothetical protein|nr:DUF4167 domain-containing protein [Candidatus Pelagibacter sp.]
MVTFRNNNNVRRNSFRRNDRNFKSNGDRPKFGSNYSNNDNFKRKAPGRNNHNAPKLIEKYNDLAREASSNGDKILSENYLQHADHFTRVMNEQDAFKKDRFSESKTKNLDSSVDKNSLKNDEIDKNDIEKKVKDTVEDKKDTVEDKEVPKSQPEVN